MMTTSQQAATKPGLRIVRRFNAPKEAVFQAFANAEALAQWWGPAGSAITVLRLEFRKGGTFHYKLEGGSQTMWGLFVYGDVTPPDKLSFTSSFSDADGRVCKSPFPMDFPLEIFNEVTLTEEAGMTTLTLQGHPVGATEVQEQTYQSIIPNMEQGFAGTLNQLQSFLEKGGSDKG